MAKLIKLQGVDGEEVIINTAHIAGVRALEDEVFDNDRKDILEKDAEAKSLINVTYGLHSSSLITRNTVEEIVSLANG